MLEGIGIPGGGERRGKIWTTVIVKSIKYIFKYLKNRALGVAWQSSFPSPLPCPAVLEIYSHFSVPAPNISSASSLLAPGFSSTFTEQTEAVSSVTSMFPHPIYYQIYPTFLPIRKCRLSVCPSGTSLSKCTWFCLLSHDQGHGACCCCQVHLGGRSKGIEL